MKILVAAVLTLALVFPAGVNACGYRGKTLGKTDDIPIPARLGPFISHDGLHAGPFVSHDG